jgi:hypothetical protein
MDTKRINKTRAIKREFLRRTKRLVEFALALTFCREQ